MENDDKRLKNLENLLDQISYVEHQKSKNNRYRIMAERAQKRYRKRRIYLVSGIAVAASLIGIILLNLDGSNTLTNMELFDKYYESYSFQTGYRADASAINPYLEAIQLYQEGDSDEAIQLITPLCQKSPDNPEYQFLRSLIYIELQEYTKAEKVLKTVISHGGSYETTGLWYLGLCAIANEEYQSAKEIFRGFASQDKEQNRFIWEILMRLKNLDSASQK